MIIQSRFAEEADSRRFVIRLEEHLELVGQLADNFGNKTFEAPEPRREFLYACRWHDRGWRDLDLNPPVDPHTRLPYNLTQTPIPIMLMTSARSSEHNEAVHPYCGLIASMHICGLYEGRYGMSDVALIDSIPSEYQAAVNALLDSEHQRQSRLRAVLDRDPRTRSWIHEGALMANYKRLQFFDMLALYFNCNPCGARRAATFSNVPLNLAGDTQITLQPADGSTYRLRPYPFRLEPLEVYFDGRFLSPWNEGTMPDPAVAMRDTPLERQTAVLLSG